MNCAEDNNPSAAQRFVGLTVRIADPRPRRELRQLHPRDIKGPCPHTTAAGVSALPLSPVRPGPSGPRSRLADRSRIRPGRYRTLGRPGLVLSKMAPVHVMLELRNGRITY